jgi:hypothetical protein
VPYAKPTDHVEIGWLLSAPRFATYLEAASGNTGRALDLYAWNARVASALMLPAHFAEITTRNAVSEALSSVYGAQWPWNQAFIRTLPDPQGPVYRPRQDLRAVAGRHQTTGKVIADLKFVFWQSMCTSRHDGRLWSPHLLGLYPYAPAQATAKDLRLRIYQDLEAIRSLRNRVAHHEPIFARALDDDLAKMVDLVAIRSGHAGSWVRRLEDVSALIQARPGIRCRRPGASRSRGVRIKEREPRERGPAQSAVARDEHPALGADVRRPGRRHRCHRRPRVRGALVPDAAWPVGRTTRALPDGRRPAERLLDGASSYGSGGAQKSQSSSSVFTALPMTYEEPEPEKKSWFSSAFGDSAARIAGLTSVSSRGNSAS